MREEWNLCVFVVWPVCLWLCLWKLQFNLCLNFWTLRDEDFIFGMNTSQRALLNAINVNDLVTFTVTSTLKIYFLDFVAARSIVFHKHVLLGIFFWSPFSADCTQTKLYSNKRTLRFEPTLTTSLDFLAVGDIGYFQKRNLLHIYWQLRWSVGFKPWVHRNSTRTEMCTHMHFGMICMYTSLHFTFWQTNCGFLHASARTPFQSTVVDFFNGVNL